MELCHLNTEQWLNGTFLFSNMQFLSACHLWKLIGINRHYIYGLPIYSQTSKTIQILSSVLLNNVDPNRPVDVNCSNILKNPVSVLLKQKWDTIYAAPKDEVRDYNNLPVCNSSFRQTLSIPRQATSPSHYCTFSSHSPGFSIQQTNAAPIHLPRSEQTLLPPHLPMPPPRKRRREAKSNPPIHNATPDKDTMQRCRAGKAQASSTSHGFSCSHALRCISGVGTLLETNDYPG